MTVADITAAYLAQVQAKQPTRRSKRSGGANNLKKVDRKAQAAARAEKWEKIKVDVEKLHIELDQKISAMALTHGLKFKAMRSIVLRLGGHVSTRRRSNRFNALKHCRARVIPDDLSPDERERQERLQEVALDAANASEVSKEDMDQMIVLLNERRENKMRGSRSIEKWRHADVRGTLRRVERELNAMDLRCDSATMMISVRTGLSQRGGPVYYCHGRMRDYIETVLGLNFEELCLLLENWCICQVKGVVQNANARKTALKGKITSLVRQGLRDITNGKCMSMVWKGYRQKMEVENGIRLAGWPSHITFNPHDLSPSQLQLIHDGLSADPPTIYWEKISPTEMETAEAGVNADIASGKIPPRKTRADKGVARGPRKTTKRRKLDDGKAASGRVEVTGKKRRREDEDDSESDESGEDDEDTSGSSDTELEDTEAEDEDEEGDE
ncbi:hypothetical protein SISNIDRAFT_482337 [Sistotremastrum niveocremeum HHB9708]|uniref:Uncharacterized protein n=1 Tax=Sistotremastrum niveocremeum HHB9708 TaxID=1314777 RepID=A0A164Z166_9AGAM|nr:hypothetical protein SISNIDRAFT_482337 [Sistotremastrum niveocremeum HHB9708]